MFCAIIKLFGTPLASKLNNSNYEDWEVPLIPATTFKFETTISYVMFYTYILIASLVTCMVADGVDLLIIAMIVQLKTHFTILKYSIKNSVENALEFYQLVT